MRSPVTSHRLVVTSHPLPADNAWLLLIAYRNELARRIIQPTAVRAVARANGMNQIDILIPCHRVIGKDGQLTGYNGGIWRQRLLLELERTGKLPSNKTTE